MANVTAFDAKTRLGKLLERAAQREEIVITKHDRPVARLIPEGQPSLTSIRDAVIAIRVLRDRIAARTIGQAKLSFDDFKSAVQAGRK
jgi:prevent-host-death family protein